MESVWVGDGVCLACEPQQVLTRDGWKAAGASEFCRAAREICSAAEFSSAPAITISVPAAVCRCQPGSRRCDHRGAARRPRRTVDGHAQSVQLTTQIMPTTPSPHTCGPSRPGSRASATPRQLFSPGRASCGFRRVSGVLIACAEEETKAWALMAAPGGGCSDVDTTGRPNLRGLT
jgi:hypothetical protein